MVQDEDEISQGNYEIPTPSSTPKTDDKDPQVNIVGNK
jgi:hypothetical protein